MIPTIKETLGHAPRTGEEKYIDFCRTEARTYLPRLATLLEGQDQELITFVQGVVDSYMMNVCRLGRKPSS